MKKLHKFILVSYLAPFVATFFIALFILLMQFLWKYIDDLVGKGLDTVVIIKLLFYASSTFVPLALPLAVLLSSLMTFGNLGERYELVAIKAAGISLPSAMKPLIFVAILISGTAFYFSNNVLPIANLKMATLLFDVREKKPALDIKEGIFYKGLDGYIIKIAKKDKDGQTLHDIMIYNHTDRVGNTELTIAKSGKMEMTADNKYLLFSLFDGYNYVENGSSLSSNKRSRGDRNLRRTHFQSQFQKFDLSSFSLQRTNEAVFRENYQMQNIKQLQYTIDSIALLVKEKYQSNFVELTERYYHLSNVAPPSPEFALQDSVRKLKPSVLANFSKQDQKIIVDNALSSARNAKSQMSENAESINNIEESVNKGKIEWHSKFALAFACFILFFIGAPMGSIIRKGGLGWPLVISVVFFLLFHVLSTMGHKFAKEGVLEPYQGMWLASAILLPIGVFLTRKAATDAPLLDADTWKKITRKVFKRK